MALGAPAAPEVGLTFGLILLGIACVLLLALNKAWQYTLGALLTTMANMVSGLPHVTVFGTKVPPWDALAAGVTELNNYVLQAIGYGIAETEAGLHAVIGWMVWIFQATADEVAGLAEDTGRAFQFVRRSLIPTLITAALLGPTSALRLLQGQVGQLLRNPAQVVHKTVRVLAPGLAALQGRVRALEAKVEAIGAAAPAAVLAPPISITIPKPGVAVDELTRGIDAIKKKLGRVTRVLSPVGIAGLVAGALLATLKLPWLKCRNVDKAGRALCGLNADVLEGMLAGLVALFGTFALVEFAKYLIPVAGEVGGEVTHFWRADVAHQGGDRALGSPSLD